MSGHAGGEEPGEAVDEAIFIQLDGNPAVLTGPKAATTELDVGQRLDPSDLRTGEKRSGDGVVERAPAPVPPSVVHDLDPSRCLTGQ